MNTEPRIMIGHRTKLSLCQFLELQDAALVGIILGKAGIPGEFPQQILLRCLQGAMEGADQHALQIVLDELVRTSGDLRARVSPKYRFEERWADLKQCLQLDGYVVDGNQVRATDPSIGDAEPIDDDLLQGLAQCPAPRASDIIRKINESSDAFRATSPNYNACLNDARVALETLAADIAGSLNAPPASQYDPSKWGSVIAHLRNCGLITLEEERGLAGVYGFVSPGSHRPIGVSEEQMARLGRSFALNMCWFLLQRRNAYN